MLYVFLVSEIDHFKKLVSDKDRDVTMTSSASKRNGRGNATPSDMTSQSPPLGLFPFIMSPFLKERFALFLCKVSTAHSSSYKHRIVCRYLEIMQDGIFLLLASKDVNYRS